MAVGCTASDEVLVRHSLSRSAEFADFIPGLIPVRQSETAFVIMSRPISQWEYCGVREDYPGQNRTREHVYRRVKTSGLLAFECPKPCRLLHQLLPE